MVKGAPHALKHNEGVTFHLFTSETTGRVRLLDADRLRPGSEGWVQVLLDEPVPMVKGDFFVLRSSEDTLGGGQVADPNPRRRHRRFAPEVLEQLTVLDAGASEDVILTIADQMGPCDLRTLSQRSNLSEAEILERIGVLIDAHEIVALGEMGVQGDAVVYSRRGWDILRNQAQVALQAYHNQYPLRRGAPPQELRSRWVSRSPCICAPPPGCPTRTPSLTITAWCAHRITAWNSATVSNPKSLSTSVHWPRSPGRRPPTGRLTPNCWPTSRNGATW